MGIVHDVHHVVAFMVAKVGAKGPADMGKVMGPLMKAYKGRVDGGKLSQAVKARLAAL